MAIQVQYKRSGKEENYAFLLWQCYELVWPWLWERDRYKENLPHYRL